LSAFTRSHEIAGSPFNFLQRQATLSSFGFPVEANLEILDRCSIGRVVTNQIDVIGLSQLIRLYVFALDWYGRTRMREPTL
jgi:hypothetical protein